MINGFPEGKESDGVDFPTMKSRVGTFFLGKLEDTSEEMKFRLCCATSKWWPN